MRVVFFILIVVFHGNFLIAQSDTTVTDTSKRKVKDTLKPKKIIVKPKLVVDSTIDNISDSIAIKDSSKTQIVDSTKILIIEDKLNYDTSSFEATINSKYYPAAGSKMFMISKKRNVTESYPLFYLITGIIFFAAFIKVSFPKYFSDIFKLFFQSSFRQKQTKEQLLQDSLPSLLMNILFCLSSGVFLTLIAKYFQIFQNNFWVNFLYSCCVIVTIYLFKYIFLTFLGWVFNISKSISNYTFVIFLINKVIGVLLLPIILLMAFALPNIAFISIIIAFSFIVILFICRYWLSFKSVRIGVKISALHFFLYLCAVEILPMVLLFKAALNIIH